MVELDPVWIRLTDGTRLAATVWLPADAQQRPVPAVLEYLPYRRRDGTIERDSYVHPWLAARGYASVRVDIRGTGDSDGLLQDEYLPQEQEDAVEVIDWLARQEWCTGRIGMFGISWGGFNALQVAARRPKELRAIITVCASDDRYTDDCHWMGGCLLNNSFAWASTMLQYVAQPPDPAIVGESWRQTWRKRLENLSLFAEPWLRHQRRDAYWRQGSIGENFDAIEAAVYAIGGWADAYTNAVPRLLSGLKSPSKGLIGPWGHAYPHIATPGPAFDFLQESLRWWDYWLKDIDTGIMEEEPLHVWLDDGARPSAVSEERAGRWIALQQWPTVETHGRHLHFGDAGLSSSTQPAEKLIVSSPIETGMAFGEWCPYGANGELPTDQRADDGRSVSLDSEALPASLQLVGAPVVKLRLASDQPTATIAVRLTDVFPDGASTLVTYGVLNLTHRGGSADPRPMRPGSVEDMTIKLNDVAYQIAAGHRIRVSISTSFWPTIWPAPNLATLVIETEGSQISLPVLPGEEVLPARRPFYKPQLLPVSSVRADDSRARTRVLTENPATKTFAVDVLRANSSYRVLKTGTEVCHQGGETYEIRGGEPLSAETRTWGRWSLNRPDWQTRTETRLRVRATEGHFNLVASIDAFEREELFLHRMFEVTIPRDWV